MLDRWFAGLVVICLLVALAGGWLAYQGHVDPGTTTDQRTVSTWNATGTITHSATVTSRNPIYPVGTTLHNKPLYLRHASPVLNGTVSVVYGASHNGTLDVNVTRRTILRAVEDTRDRTVVVWERLYRVDTRSVASVKPGSAVRVPFSVNVSRLMNVSERADENFDNPPGQPRLIVNTTVELSGTVNGQPVNRTEAYPLAVEFDGSAYRVTANGTTERFETTRAVEVPQESGSLQLIGGPLLLLVGLVGAGGLVAARTQNRLELTKAEREYLAYEDDREDFEEWISTIRLPEDVYDRPRARADSLGHLVDFAIDTDTGVINDPEKGLYCVLHGEYLYTYRPPMEADLMEMMRTENALGDREFGDADEDVGDGDGDTTAPLGESGQSTAGSSDSSTETG